MPIELGTVPASIRTDASSRPIRILHVVGCMDRGGIETWLMQILRNIDRSRFQMDFLVHTAKPGAYDNEIEASGSRIIPCLGARRPWVYAANFQQRSSVEQKIHASGLMSRFVLAGARDDVSRLMLGAMDVLLFPSLWEGLPMTVIESQAAGLPFVGSTAVPEEAVVAPWLVRRMGLEEPIHYWAQAVVEGARLRDEVEPDRARMLMSESQFTVERSVSSLEKVYETQARMSLRRAA